MSRTVYACVHAAEFPAQALLRLRPDLQAKPVAVLEGSVSEETVCALNRSARLKGASLGMTRLEAEGIHGLMLLSRSAQGETSARTVLMECAAKFSPRIEEVSRGTSCAFVLDIAGTERLFGPTEQLATRLMTTLAEAGFRASIVVSANFDVARLKAAASRGITVIAEGEEANALERLPIAALDLALEHEETFALWGVRTLGELSALPETELVTRLGHIARDWRELARGSSTHILQPIEPAFALKEFCEFDTHVEQIDSLLFIGSRMVDCLVVRASTRAMALASLTVQMKLEGGQTYRCVIRPALPSIDRKFLLKLLQLEIAAHPPQAAVVSIALTAEAGQSSKVQLGLFTPETPEPSRLDVTLARLKALVGEDRVGSPVLEDTHKPGSFRMQAFSVDGTGSAAKAAIHRIALRRMRQPVPVRVTLRAAKPVAFRDSENRFEVTAAYGPWRSSGCWWSSDGWDADEWDVLAAHAGGAYIACVLVFDRTRNHWQLEALYD